MGRKVGICWILWHGVDRWPVALRTGRTGNGWDESSSSQHSGHMLRRRIEYERDTQRACYFDEGNIPTSPLSSLSWPPVEFGSPGYYEGDWTAEKRPRHRTQPSQLPGGKHQTPCHFQWIAGWRRQPPTDPQIFKCYQMVLPLKSREICYWAAGEDSKDLLEAVWE